MYCSSKDETEKKKILGSINMLRSIADFKSKEN